MRNKSLERKRDRRKRRVWIGRDKWKVCKEERVTDGKEKCGEEETDGKEEREKEETVEKSEE